MAVENRVTIRSTFPNTRFVEATNESGSTLKTTVPSPTTLGRWVKMNQAEAIDGCRVGLDHACAHGWPAWTSLEVWLQIAAILEDS